MTEGRGRAPLYAVVYQPRLDWPALDAFRRRYDPLADLVEEHLTLIFPVPMELGTLRAHVRSIGTETAPFAIRISGLRRTWDQWLSLRVRDGRDELVALHDRLYSGPLEKHLRADLPYEPQIGIGFFGKGRYDPLDPAPVELDRTRFDAGLAEAAGIGIDATRIVESLTIVALDAGLNRVSDMGGIQLKRQGPLRAPGGARGQ